ncbi:MULTISPECIES: coagulation factor 5/8 type domain-containing protein [Streptomyces]|uniref:Coagulation factor 5/8 type domain-containing protein n=2 Tax=Streptomyces TaxID=1883 RepID=A0ABU2RKI3_9ACTN|nr:MULTISPECIES: coagulation factor 5/8 type domain-containing protein [unclassified Streptomyces]MBK3592204.1 coagulation factor 5/8 type domain-containing protein [Streptomyces sp. MBT51]MDT0428987.1 coagulation factor 5/8 type domain-containing protein [Streptomyces sp. DSM 41770]
MHGLTRPRPTGSSAGAPGSPVTVYDTEVRAEGEWERAPRLTVRLDRGHGTELLELAWRSEDGAEATVVFDEGTGGFRGHRRAADGTPQEYRGTESRRRADAADVTDCRTRVFATEVSGPGAPVTGGMLRLVLDDGGAPVERVTWRDRRDTFISVALRAAPWAESTVPVKVGEVVASDEHPEADEVADNLLGDGPDKWLGWDDRATLDFSPIEPTAVTAYALTSANDYRDRDPRDWRLLGSMDGSTWYTLDDRVNEAFPERLQERAFTVVNSTAYRVYRLDIGRNWGGLPETQLNRVRLLTTDRPGLIGVTVPVAEVTANDEYRAAGEVAANVLHSGEGKWLARSRQAWLEFALPERTAVTAYTLTSADDHCARDPKDWVLEGSADGADWVPLDRRSGETFAGRFLVREFDIAAPAAYGHYRLRVTANEGDVGEVQLNRVQLLAKSDDGLPVPGEFSGILRHGGGPTADYRGRGVAEEADRDDDEAVGVLVSKLEELTRAIEELSGRLRNR